MTFQEYINQVRDDALEAIEAGEYDDASDVDDALDTMWIDDAITGNGSGSYTFSAARAAEYVADVIFDDEFLAELEGLGEDLGDLVKRGPEAVDVTARCLALGYIRDDVEEALEERRDNNQEA